MSELFDEYSECDLKRDMSKALRTLSPREEYIIRALFFEKMNQNELARMYGVTRQRVNQIKAKALAKLNNERRAKYIKPYLFN